LTTASGLLLQPSRPATAVDVQILQVCFISHINWSVNHWSLDYAAIL